MQIPAEPNDKKVSAENETGLSEPHVFQRTEATGPLVGAAAYNAVIGLVLLWGFAINWLIVRYVSSEDLRSISPLVFLLAYLVSCSVGVALFTSCTDPWISFLGYNFVVVPFGLVINVVVSRYDPSLVVEAMKITGMVTIIMMMLGVLFAPLFQAARTALVAALLAVILVEFLEILVLGTVHGWADWVVCLVFCGYIGHDWGRANRIPKTVDNAVDSAAAIYMDIINLFLRVLRILGRSRK